MRKSIVKNSIYAENHDSESPDYIFYIIFILAILCSVFFFKLHQHYKFKSEIYLDVKQRVVSAIENIHNLKDNYIKNNQWNYSINNKNFFLWKNIYITKPNETQNSSWTDNSSWENDSLWDNIHNTYPENSIIIHFVLPKELVAENRFSKAFGKAMNSYKYENSFISENEISLLITPPTYHLTEILKLKETSQAISNIYTHPVSIVVFLFWLGICFLGGITTVLAIVSSWQNEIK